MKSHIIRQPELTVTLELNQKHNRGYQIRLLMPERNLDSVYNQEIFGLADAVDHAIQAVEMINEEMGFHYNAREMIHITGDALKVNSKWDVYSSKFMKDKDGEYIVPLDEAEEEEIAFTAQGVILVTFFSWRDDKLPKAKEALQRYCDYLAERGHSLSSADIWTQLESMDKDQGASWINATYSEFVRDDNEIMECVMGREM